MLFVTRSVFMVHLYDFHLHIVRKQQVNIYVICSVLLNFFLANRF